jgi:glycosyltransferase involved in cell wall biosynthesis
VGATSRSITVAIPVRNGGRLFEQTLSMVREQKLGGSTPIQILVCDSGSNDGSVAVARRCGAEVFCIDPADFSHGRTRNLLMQRAEGTRVAFLTQDAVPADELWLARLQAGFNKADAVGLVFGPYLPRADASPMVVRELTEWFAEFSPDGRPRVDRLGEHERDLSERDLLGPRGFFTDANGCVAKAAWEVAPFRDVPYAEDHALAHDLMRAGFAKVFVPEAAVVHSHDYSWREWLRRSFDEARALHDIYDFQEQRGLQAAAVNVWGRVGADVRFARRLNLAPAANVAARSLPHHLARAAGTILGAYSDRLPPGVMSRLSLERRG